VDIPDYFHTLMLMLMGQFLDHDMSKTAGSKIAKAEGQCFYLLNFVQACILYILYQVLVLSCIYYYFIIVKLLTYVL